MDPSQLLSLVPSMGDFDPRNLHLGCKSTHSIVVSTPVFHAADPRSHLTGGGILLLFFVKLELTTEKRKS